MGGLDTNDEDAGEMGVWDDGLYFDERTGEALDPNLVRTAEGEEIAFLKRIDLYVETDVAECWAKTGKAPISTKWVKVNKGTVEAPEVRCRLVARDFKPTGEKDRGGLVRGHATTGSEEGTLSTGGQRKCQEQSVWKRMH